MAKGDTEPLYNYKLDFDEPGRSIHERGSGSEQSIEDAIHLRYPNAFYEEVAGGWDVWTSETAAETSEDDDRSQVLGWVRLASAPQPDAETKL
jgi:hypothetical protein